MQSGLVIQRAVPRPIIPARDGFRLIRPVILAGLATTLLYAAVDRTSLWSMWSCTLGILLLGAVLTKQLGEILKLETEVLQAARRLSVVSEIVSLLNSATTLGSSLGVAMDKLVASLGADAGAIWLPAADGRDQMVLIEQRGLPHADFHPEWLERVRAAFKESTERIAYHEDTVPLEGSDEAQHVHCLTIRMGSGDEEFGYITLARCGGSFGEIEGTVLGAVGSDIGNALRNLRLVSEARRLADRDPVTGLYNHRSAYQRLHQELERASRSGKPMSVLMMDLDNFKLFNDTYGHPAGDEVLKRVSAVLKRSCRDTDVVARYGGDEFIVLLPEASMRAAVRCAERIQGALAKERFRCEDSYSLPIGFSYGVATFPDDAKDVQELVSLADSNLYQSKSAGGNQITSPGSGSIDNALMYVKGFDLFRAMVQAIDNKDGYTRKHSEEVTEYSVEIARAMGVTDEMIQTIQLSGILHDVGKIGVPDHILRKPGHLTDEEFDIMRQHPVFGALIVGAMPGMDEVVHGVRHHHERWDGRGYPDRLSAENIPLIGRIMAVGDAYSAMTTSRPYRKGLTERQALKEIRAGLGTQFDPEIGALFITLREAKLAEANGNGTRSRTSRTKPLGPPPAEEPVAAQA